MFKIKFVILLILLSCCFLYGENIFENFVNIYNGNGNNYRLIGTFTDVKDNIPTVNDFNLITGKDYKLMYYINKNLKSLFLANNQGYFVQGINQQSPLKISGNYTVSGAVNASDVMSIDFYKDYEVSNIGNGGEIILKKINKSIPYAKAILKKTSFGYSIDFIDNTGKAIKRGIYILGEVSGYTCFRKIEFYNLIINTNMSTSYEIVKVEPVNISGSYFRSENMKMLFTLFDGSR